MRETVSRRQIASFAAATAFWFFLSLVPIVVLAVSVLPYTALSEEQLLAFLAPAVPDSFNELIIAIVSDVYRSNLAILSVSLAATLWSAARGFSSLIRGMEEIYQHDQRSGFLRRRARGAISTAAMLLFILLSIVIGGFGRHLLLLADKYLPGIARLIRFLLSFRVLLVIAVLTLFFSAVFRWGTRHRPPMGPVLPGALFAAVGWSMLTRVFSAWVSVTGFGTYGSLATVVVVMLWMYYCQYLLLLGACLNCVLPGLQSRTSPEDPKSDKL